MQLSTAIAIEIADEIATAIVMPYRYREAWQLWRDTESRPAWNRHEVVRAAVSLARVPEPRH